MGRAGTVRLAWVRDHTIEKRRVNSHTCPGVSSENRAKNPVKEYPYITALGFTQRYAHLADRVLARAVNGMW